MLLAFSFLAQEENLVHPNRVYPEIVEGKNKKAEFPGGQTAMNQFIIGNVVYPKKAKRKKEEGTVWVQFIIEANGSIYDPKVSKSVSELLDAEAIRVVKLMPNWSPELNHGKVVRTKYQLPIKFSLHK